LWMKIAAALVLFAIGFALWTGLAGKDGERRIEAATFVWEELRNEQAA